MTQEQKTTKTDMVIGFIGGFLGAGAAGCSIPAATVFGAVCAMALSLVCMMARRFFP